jgi:hypothetical protein
LTYLLVEQILNTLGTQLISDRPNWASRRITKTAKTRTNAKKHEWNIQRNLLKS